MRLYRVACSQCNKIFFRDKRRINEAKKFGWKTYCSFDCQYSSKNSQIECVCSRPGCGKVFNRQRKEYSKSINHYCSHSCAAIVTNSSREKKFKICANDLCKKKFTGSRKYCSLSCIPIPQTKYSKRKILTEIRNFVRENRRLPIKQELIRIYIPLRKHFGTWNNAIKASKLEPNPVMFAKKYIANDGHKCDSLSEKIIDDWFYARGIKHEINYPYPGNSRFTVDFKVEDYWIEFFGLNGEHRRYDELKKKKLKLAKKKKLKLIEVYPEHLFPKSILDEVLSALIN